MFRSARTPLRESFLSLGMFSYRDRGMSSGGRGRVRLELETVLEAASVLEAALVAACCWWARLSEEMESGVLMGSTPGPACSALYLMLVYSRPTSWDFCSAASLDTTTNLN